MEIGKKEQIILLFIIGIILFGGGYKLAEQRSVENPKIIKGDFKDQEEGSEGEAMYNPVTVESERKNEQILVHIVGAVVYLNFIN